MRILYFFKNLDTIMYQWQNYHIVDEMKTHGCQVEILSPLQYESLEMANEAAVRKLKTGQYGLFMTCHNEEVVFETTVSCAKELGIPTLLFCPDNLVDPFRHRKCAPWFDLVWLTSAETEYMFKRWKCNTVFLPYAANPEFLKPRFDATEIERVGFIGTPHGSRVERINSLVRADVPVSIHANAARFQQKMIQAKVTDYASVLYDNLRYPIGRKLALAALIDKLWYRKINLDHEMIDMQQPVPLAELGGMNSRYAMVLSFTEASSTGVLKKPVNIVNLRNFEVPMSGGLQLTMYSDEIAGYFEDGKEIVLASSVEEFTDKAKFYLRPEQKENRLAMKQAARRRAEAEHTWYNRFSAAFERLGLQ